MLTLTDDTGGYTHSGDGCVEKPLATLWRNYTQNSKPDVMMKLCLCPSGLKATTRQHGLTEYWSHRITYCSSPKNYPRVFCWIYRHEGRKLKHEFRCHAVICSKESIAQEISTILKENLAKALREFKRDKLNRQNARLSLANSVYDNPSMPRRKIMLSVGANNYRPPLERSKSAPKLMAIEEMIGEEDEEDDETQEGGEGVRASKAASSAAGVSTTVEACCREDALFPSTTLGRRRCRRGHSIRRSRLRNSFKSPKDLEARVPLKNENIVHVSPMNKSVDSILDTISQEDGEEEDEDDFEGGEPCEEVQRELSEEQTASTVASLKLTKSAKLSHNSDSSEDDFESFLAHYNYNSSEPLSSELISYFDMKLNPTTVCSMHDLTQHHASLPVTLEDTQRLALSLDDLDHYSLPGVVVVGEADGGGSEVRTRELKERDVDLDTDEVFFNQDEVLEMLRTAAESAASASASHDRLRHSGCLHTEDDTAPSSLLCVTSKLQAAGAATHPDSDEGSISSGCETSSTVTTNTDDSATSGNGPAVVMVGRAAITAALGKPGSVLERVRSFEQLAENQVIHVPLGERAGQHPLGADSDNITASPELMFKRSITFPAPGVKSSFLMPTASLASSGSASGPTEPTDSPLDSLNDPIVEAHRREMESHHQHHQTTKPKVRQMRLKSTVAAVNTELINHLQAIDSDSEFSDESGYVEFQDNQPSIKSSFPDDEQPDNNPASLVGKMEALVENAAAPPSRFYCHSCAIEIDRVSPEFTCPHCLEGFIEELPAAERNVASGSASGQDFEQPMNEYDNPQISNEAIRLAGEIFTNSFLSPLFRRNDGQDGESTGTTGGGHGEHTLITLEDIPMDGSGGSSSGGGGVDLGEGSAGGGASGSGGGSSGGPGGDARPSMRYSGRRGSRRRGVQNINHVDHILREILISVSGGAHGGGAGGGSMLFMGNPGDYAWGREGIDTIVTQLLNQMDNTGPPPLEKERIAEIPTVTISEEQVERKLQCSVCFEDFVVGESVRKLPCLHVYHEPCIIPWLELHGTCPICRNSLSPEESHTGAQSQGQANSSTQSQSEGSQLNPQQQQQQQTSSSAQSQSDANGRQGSNFLTVTIRPAMTNLLFEMGQPSAPSSGLLTSSLPASAGGAGATSSSSATGGSTSNRSSANPPTAGATSSSGGTGGGGSGGNSSQRDEDGTIDYTLELD
uniref:RING-type E3 ubiquitin transferase n=1 Tax=Anopheles dirus TaxID=7168 RepID=A0A182NQG9_9DIPT